MHLDSLYPAAVFCIIATEFCERFSFCGLRTILSLYLRNVLEFSEDSSTVIYHIFIMGCYVVPIVGAIHADSYFGRYRTIRNFSLIYLMGNLFMCLAAIPILDHNPILLSSLGLLLIAIGTGGLKPCIAAFGAEQFRLPEQRQLLRYFFSVFYFTINLGGFVGMVVTPVMRKAVSCFGDDTCYVLGFGFPAALMLLSILLFIMGKGFYKVKTPKRNVILEFLKCSWKAILNKKRSSTIRYDHWLDYAKSDFDMKLIHDMKMVFSVLLLFVPLPIFWSLFDQQGSRWTFQASHMDTNVLGIQVVPDQMQVINPAMVLVLIPIFDKVVYPRLEKFNVWRNSLHRMALGGLAAGLAFISAGILELFLERTYPDLPDKNHGSLNVINALPCDISVLTKPYQRRCLNTGSTIRYQNMQCINQSRLVIIAEAPKFCRDITLAQEILQIEGYLQEKQETTLIISYNRDYDVKGYMIDRVDFSKSVSGNPKIRIDYVKNMNAFDNVSAKFQSTFGLTDVYFFGEESGDSQVAVSPYLELPQGLYECYIQSGQSQEHFRKHLHFAFGGVYSLIIRENNRTIEFVKLLTMSSPNSVNILWQLPQYLFISVAEIMFGVAGLEFSFTQAPKSMKTVTIAGWYLSTAVGNLIVIIITKLNFFNSQAYEFFLFALIIVADMMIFAEMATKYHFVELEADSSVLIMNQKPPHLDGNA